MTRGLGVDVVEISRRRGRLGGRPQWRWRYRDAGNNKLLAGGGEGYNNLADLQDTLRRVLNIERSVALPTQGHRLVRRNSDWPELLIVVER